MIIVAASNDPSLPADKILRAICEAFGGHGGGRADFAQGGGMTEFDTEKAYAIIQEHMETKE